MESGPAASSSAREEKTVSDKPVIGYVHPLIPSKDDPLPVTIVEDTPPTPLPIVKHLKEVRWHTAARCPWCGRGGLELVERYSSQHTDHEVLNQSRLRPVTVGFHCSGCKWNQHVTED